MSVIKCSGGLRRQRIRDRIFAGRLEVCLPDELHGGLDAPA